MIFFIASSYSFPLGTTIIFLIFGFTYSLLVLSWWMFLETTSHCNVLTSTEFVSGAYRVDKVTLQCPPKMMPKKLGQLRSFILLNVYIMLLSVLLFVPLKSNLWYNVTIYWCCQDMVVGLLWVSWSLTVLIYTLTW